LNFRNTKTLGLGLVVMLIDQLDGTIELHRGHGTKFKINFKKLKYEKRF
jgi:two-component sensor histidine kinase